MTTAHEVVARLHREAPLTDVHAHPSLKAYLFGRNLWRHYGSGGAFNPFASRTDFPSLGRGGVGVVWAAHYVPEAEIFRDCWLAGAAARFSGAYGRLTAGTPLDRLLAMMAVLEREIARAPNQAELARSVADVDRIRAARKIAVVHAVEGAHVLGGDPERVGDLAEAGVAMITLTHFYANGLAAHVDGVPRDLWLRKLCTFDFGVNGAALTERGRAVLAAMTRHRMLVDVSHCTPAARAAIYAELEPGRPIIASHVGVRHLNPDAYNLDDDEIREIARRGGAVGVIFMPYWLSAGNPKNGLDAICDTMEHVHAVTGSWDNVMIGTDFDGFTDPPDDVPDTSELPRVTHALLDRGVAEDDVRKILGGNARRVLERGWR
jgi:microsomal dipeptidase-like Zn-dependent dipeptidase